MAIPKQERRMPSPDEVAQLARIEALLWVACGSPDKPEEPETEEVPAILVEPDNDVDDWRFASQ